MSNLGLNCLHTVKSPRILKACKSILPAKKPVNMPKESQGHLLQNICKASSRICGHSLKFLHNKGHQKGRSCPTEGSQICNRRLHQQCHCHDREPLVGNPPTQKTASQGHYDVRIVHVMVAIPASPHLQLLGAATRGHQ